MPALHTVELWTENVLTLINALPTIFSTYAFLFQKWTCDNYLATQCYKLQTYKPLVLKHCHFVVTFVFKCPEHSKETVLQYLRIANTNNKGAVSRDFWRFFIS